MALVEVKNLKKYFYGPKGAVHAVDDVTMNIDAGETMGVVGESGCGKSTLGRTIIHLQKSTGGSVHFNGKDITNPTPQELKKLRSDVQIIFQDPYSSLNPRMTVEDTIKEPLLISGKCDKQNVDAETERLMDMVGIARRIKMSYPHELDYGEDVGYYEMTNWFETKGTVLPHPDYRCRRKESGDLWADTRRII